MSLASTSAVRLSIRDGGCMAEGAGVVEAPKKEKLKGSDYLLSFQHLFAMFGATVLVPLMTGMNASLALFAAGVGTLIFHLCTKFKVPVFLGSSFAFIPAVAAVTMTLTNAQGQPMVDPSRIPLAQGGIIAAGLLYLVFALLVYLAGAERIRKFFPPVVTGPVIMVIGITLASVGIGDAFGWADLTKPLEMATYINMGVAVFTLAVVIISTVVGKGFFRLVPILIGIAAGYGLCWVLSQFGLFHMDLSAIGQAAWINIPFVTKDANGVPFGSLPKFNWGIILSIAPIAIVSFMEHIGDITTNGAVVGKDFIREPGMHRTLLGDGLATAFAGLIGGPANTTYSENTGVLATTKNYNPRLLRLTALFAIALGLFGKFGAILQTIPGPVRGGIEIMLFGMIAAIGLRTLAESKLDFTHSRNLIIVGVILIVGLGVGSSGITVPLGTGTLVLSGLFLAVIIGVLLNMLLPEDV